MARESCNLGNDEAEVLRSSSPSPSSSPQNPSSTSSASHLAPQQSTTCLLLKSSEDFSAQMSEGPEIVANDLKISSLPKSKDGDSRPPAFFGHRCSTCRKRVGLAGFRCRCGDLFCARHRYSETHNCSFDYKAAGRDEISKANPVIRAAKIIRI